MLGMPLNRVIACVTANAARVMPAFSQLGTLAVGAPADVTVLELRKGAFDFVDNEHTTRTGAQKLVAVQVVSRGALLKVSI
jgi:dihydroorotase